MSIIKCEQCEINIDTEEEPTKTISGKEFCENCADEANSNYEDEVADHTSWLKLSQ